MKYGAAVVVFLLLAGLFISTGMGFGLMQLLVATGLAIMAYGLVDKFAKKDGENAG